MVSWVGVEQGQRDSTYIRTLVAAPVSVSICPVESGVFMVVF